VANIGVLLAAFDEQARPEPAPPPAGVGYQRDGPLLRVVGLHQGYISTPRDVGVRGLELDRLIMRQRDYFAARNQAVEWKTYGYDETPGLTDRLLCAGFVGEDQETVLIGLTEDMAVQPVLPERVTLRQVSAEADMRRIGDLQSAVWNEDLSWQADELIRHVTGAQDDEIAVFVAEADGAVVSSARLEFRLGTEFAGLWGGATLPEWRGRGIYRALVARRAQLALGRGVRYLQVDASNDSAPILRRLGFHAVTTTTPYVWTPQS
jgi:ribosomal protein S18 acetylase RimI-like enzyme